MNIIKTIVLLFVVAQIPCIQAFDEALSLSANGTVPTPRAFFRDDQLWPVSSLSDSVIPVCWENYDTEIQLNPKWMMLMEDTIKVANTVWGNTLPDKDSSGNPINVNATGSTSLLKFQTTTEKQCPPVGSGFTGIRILVSSTETLDGVKAPFVRALGNELKDLENGVVLDFDFKNDSINQACKISRFPTTQECYYGTYTHEFGHVIGMSHEQNRDDDPFGDPIFFPPCAIDDSTASTEGQLLIGTLKIGHYDFRSIMNYCNKRRLIAPVLSETDQAAVWAFYGRSPSTQSDVGYPVITIPVVLVGISESPRNLILTDQNNDGKYTYSLGTFPTSGKSSVKVNYNKDGDLLLNIPFMIRTESITGRRIITDIYKVQMKRDTVTNTFIDIPDTKTTLYSVRLQNP